MIVDNIVEGDGLVAIPDFGRFPLSMWQSVKV